MIVKAPPKGRTLVCHRNGYVTISDGFFWNYTCLPTKKEMDPLSPKERARVRKHLGWD